MFVEKHAASTKRQRPHSTRWNRNRSFCLRVNITEVRHVWGCVCCRYDSGLRALAPAGHSQGHERVLRAQVPPVGLLRRMQLQLRGGLFLPRLRHLPIWQGGWNMLLGAGIFCYTVTMHSTALLNPILLIQPPQPRGSNRRKTNDARPCPLAASKSPWVSWTRIICR
jgi:hypothetical protein